MYPSFTRPRLPWQQFRGWRSVGPCRRLIGFYDINQLCHCTPLLPLLCSTSAQWWIDPVIRKHTFHLYGGMYLEVCVGIYNHWSKDGFVDVDKDSMIHSKSVLDTGNIFVAQRCEKSFLCCIWILQLFFRCRKWEEICFTEMAAEGVQRATPLGRGVVRDMPEVQQVKVTDLQSWH